MRSGELDDALVYRKNLRKERCGVHGDDAAACGRGTQVDAAAGRLISYVMTTAGPEPIDNVSIRSTASTTSRSR